MNFTKITNYVACSTSNHQIKKLETFGSDFLVVKGSFTLDFSHFSKKKNQKSLFLDKKLIFADRNGSLNHHNNKKSLIFIII